MFARTRAPFVLALASIAATPAQAQRVAIDIPRGALADAIAALSAQTGVSIGTSGPLPALRVAGIHGKIDVGEALNRMLAGSGWRARRVSDRVWRIEPMPPAAPPPVPAKPAIPAQSTERAAPEEEDIIVTGRKRPEPLGDAAATIVVVPGSMLDARGRPGGSAAVAAMVDGLSVTSLGPGRNRMFIRGVADSPFDGFGQASVSVVVDDARATYDAPDPDLRLVDVDRVELLKGPQGPLYGTGALGGIYRVVTRKPDPASLDADLAAGADGIDHGGVGGHVQAMLNLPLADNAAIRAVGYALAEPGWIDTIGGERDINRTDTSGGRLALRVTPAAGWTIDVAGAAQFIGARDSSYVDGASRYARSARTPEPHDVDFRLASLEVAGRIGALTLTSVTSLTAQELRATYDASALATALGSTAPAQYRDDRQYHLFNQELRLASPGDRRLTYLTGLSILYAITDATGTLSDASGPRTVLTLRRHVRELAGFGEATFNWSPQLSATLGGRLFHSYVEDTAREASDVGVAAGRALHVAPSAALRWHDDRGDSLYLRYAGALRPGGAEAVTAGSTSGSYGADEISTTELGVRIQRRHLFVTAATFFSAWHDVQADYLRPDGLVTTRNAGDAVNRGVEASIDWKPDAWLSISAGMIAQHGVLTRPAAPVAAGDDPRLPVVPDLALRATLARRFDFRGWSLQSELRATYTGAARLSFDPGLDRRIPPLGLLGLGLSADRDGWSVRLDVDNLLDTSVDRFGFGNPFSIRIAPQRTPLRPRELSLTLARHF